MEGSLGFSDLGCGGLGAFVEADYASDAYVCVFEGGTAVGDMFETHANGLGTRLAHDGRKELTRIDISGGAVPALHDTHLKVVFFRFVT